MKPTEEKCRDCEFFSLWPGNYGGGGGYPACSHGDAGSRVLTLLDELDECPTSEIHG